MENNLLHLLRLLGILAIGVAVVRLFTLHSARRRSGAAAGGPAGGRLPHPWFGRFTPHVPNAMSLLRIPLGLWMLLVALLPPLQSKPGFWSFHLAFLLVCLFDALDGYFARKWGAVSADGKSLDPASDKFVTLCLATAAFWGGELPAWAFVLLAGREVASLIQRARLQRRGLDVSARWLGKLKTPIQFAVLYILILRIPDLPVVLGIERLFRLLPAGLALWGVVLMSFFTLISIFPFFPSFFYVNQYAPANPARPRQSALRVLVPNLFTVGNYLCGVTAVFFAMPSHTESAVAGPFVSLFWLLAAGLCDAVDGPLARKLNTFSEFGACLDSAMDLSTFGLAAACVIYFQLTGLLFAQFAALPSALLRLAAGTVAFLFFLAVHLRLARFTRQESRRLDHAIKTDFTGMPSPAGAVGALVLFTFFRNPILIALLLLALAALMNSRFNFPNLASLARIRFYRFLFIPGVLLTFLVLSLLMFGYPFVTRSCLRFITGAFPVIAWGMTLELAIYSLHGMARGRLPAEPDAAP